MLCSTCGSENREGAKFCAKCAAPLLVAGYHSATSLRAPPASGAPPALPTSERLTGERRHLTVLFCDLVGSTSIAANLDPEDWREIVTSYHNCATYAVTRFGGYVAQLLGDGLLVFFGYPEAHEDDAQRAVLAGLAILEAMAGLNQRLIKSPPLAARVGIHSGSVVVDESADPRSNVFGDVTHIAARVQSAAAPDTVLITAAVHHLVSGWFVVEDQGSQRLRGIEQPIQLYRAVQPSGARGRLAASAFLGLTPFVGRDDEMRLLLNRWERARGGRGQVVLIIGEPGIGKSRVVQQFRELILDTPHTWVESAASPLHQNTPFYPIEDFLQQGLRWRKAKTPDEAIADLETSLKRAGIDLVQAVPLIAPLMNLAIPARYPVLQIPADQQRKRLLTTIVNWALGTARIQPLVAVVEDLHWADPSTLEAIELLAESNARAPILMLCSARPEFRSRWVGGAHHTQLTLSALSAQHAREMLARLTAHTPLSVETVDALVRRSGGVPLFVEELVRAVSQSGKYEKASDEIPATLRDSLMARLDRLRESKEVAQIAAVIGEEFSWDLLSAVAGLEDEQCTKAIKELITAEILYEYATPLQKGYRFRHALIQDAAYQSLLNSKRRAYHRRIAQLLEERFPEITDAQPQLPAYHYSAANLAGQAIPHWLKAGQKAIQRSANAEAISHLTNGLQLLETQPEGPERLQQELTLQVVLGTPLIATYGFAAPKVGKVYARARELCAQAGEAPQLFPVLWGLWVFHTARAEHETARELAEQCLRLAEKAGDPILLLAAHHALGVTLTGLADLSAGLEHLQKVILTYDPAVHGSMAFLYGQDPKVVCLSQAAWTYWVHGYPECGHHMNLEAIALARKISHPYSLAAALNFGAIVYQFTRNEQLVQECADTAISVSTEQGFALWRPWAYVLRGWATAHRGEMGEGIKQMREGIEQFRATGAEVMVPYFLTALASLYGKLARVDDGLRLLADAQAVIDRGHERWWEAEVYREKGELTLLKAGRSAGSPCEQEAQEYFLQSINIASRQSAKSLELRAVMSLGRLWQTQGKIREARSILAESYSWFKEGLETPDLVTARTLLDELS